MMKMIKMRTLMKSLKMSLMKNLKMSLVKNLTMDPGMRLLRKI